MESSLRGKPVRGASLSKHVSTRGTRGGYSGSSGLGRGMSRFGNRGRRGHHHSFGTRTIGNEKEEEIETKTIA